MRLKTSAISASSGARGRSAMEFAMPVLDSVFLVRSVFRAEVALVTIAPHGPIGANVTAVASPTALALLRVSTTANNRGVAHPVTGVNGGCLPQGPSTRAKSPVMLFFGSANPETLNLRSAHVKGFVTAMTALNG
jgi:hypothetical protein